MSSSRARFSTEGSLKGLPAMEILDQAVSLLRHAPPAVLSVYFLGSLPFSLGLIYFWFDMTQSAYAEKHLPGDALTLTLLYFWMKTCQAIFARHLLTILEGEDLEPWTVRRWINIALLQAIYAASLLIVYPATLLITIPFGWVNAFYHNISIVATSSKSTLGSTFREAADMARLWPKQNHLILGTLLLAVLALFLNLAVFFIMIPQLLNSLFGVETVFDENISVWNNSSFYLDVSVFCFLILNPLNKTIYVLRCFYGQARLSGTDLKAELRHFHLLRRDQIPLRTVALAFVLALTSICGTVQADPVAPVETTPTPQTDPSVKSLDQAIQKTLQKDEFTWRLPREEVVAQDEGFFTRMLRSVVDYFKNALRGPIKAFGKALGDFFKWLFGNTSKHDSLGNGLSIMAAIPWRLLLLLLAVIFILVLAYMLLRHFRNQEPAVPLDTLKAATVRTVDLEAENVQADELPEDSWLALAQQLIERGDLRLALRAFYLATLSALARQQLVRLGAAKSNRDYLVELTRRLRGESAVIPIFRENVRLFEASWYGTHAVTSAIIETMRTNQQQVGRHVAT